MDRAFVEALLASEAAEVGALEDLDWLGVMSRVSQPSPSFPGGFAGEERYRREASHSPQRSVRSLRDVGVDAWRGVGDAFRGAASARPERSYLFEDEGVLDLLGRLDSQEFQSWMYPLEGVSRAVGGVIEGRNPLEAAAFGGPLVSDALRERGAPEWLAVGSEFLVPDPTGASRAGDMVPLAGLLASRVRQVFDVASLPPQAATSARTSIRQVRGDVASSPAVFTWLERNRPLEPGSINLDIGGGRYDDTSAFVADRFNAQSLVYDPYNRTPEHNAAVINQVINAGGADTVTVSNVLNVISDEGAQLRVIEQAREGLKNNGEAFFTVYQGDGTGVGRMTGADTYQANKKTREYLPLIQRIFGEGNVSIRGNVIIARKPTVDTTDLANLIDNFQ